MANTMAESLNVWVTKLANYLGMYVELEEIFQLRLGCRDQRSPNVGNCLPKTGMFQHQELEMSVPRVSFSARLRAAAPLRPTRGSTVEEK